MEVPLSPMEDYPQTPKEDTREVLTFVFATANAAISGVAEITMTEGRLEEILVLHEGSNAWHHRATIELPPAQVPMAEIGGQALNFACLEPWQQWRIHMLEEISAAGETGVQAAVDLAMTFRSVTPPATFDVDDLRMAHQDGLLQGTLQIGAQRLRGELPCYRRHTRGTLLEEGGTGWTFVILPGALFVAILDVVPGPMRFGRIVRSDGAFTQLTDPQIETISDGWRVTLPGLGDETWQARRMVAPITYRKEITSGGSTSATENFRVEITPVILKMPGGEERTGFVEKAHVVREAHP